LSSWFRPKKTTPVLIIFFAVAILFTRLFSGCTPQKAVLTSNSVPLPPPTVATVPVPLEITPFFTDPAIQGKNAPGWKIINSLVTDINASDRSVAIAMYNFSLNEIGDALISAVKRGVDVHLVVDSDAMEGTELRRLKNSGIKILGDRHESLMHNKFVVIDRQIIWTGSLNLTFSGAMDDENNFVRILSPELAVNYLQKFDDMFVNDRFGPDSRSRTAATKFKLSGRSVENYFSPEDTIDTRLVALVGSAKKSVHILAYSFTLDRLADALIKAGKNGVEIRGVFDADSTADNQGADFAQLKKSGLDVRLDGLEGLMHQKVLIIDGETVMFGSYNFTASAENRNDENVLILKDPALAESFEQAFERIYIKSKN
jgi:phosphatidylserine/phosphatidylglycerophosphate/cardiolipin synthase-like enzyme